MPLISLLTRLSFIAGIASSPAAGAEISRHANDSAKLNAIYLSGQIERGDAAKLRAYIDTLPRKPVTTVYLNSTGGSFQAGLDLGYLFRAEGIRTVVEGNGALCASSCAVAFMGGFDKKTGKPWRTKSSSSLLAFHAFYAKLSKASYSPIEVDQMLYSNTFSASQMITYFTQVDGDLSLLTQALRMREQQVYSVSNEQAIEIGINVWDEKTGRMRLARAPSLRNQ